MNLFELDVKIRVDDQASAQISKISTGLGKGVVDASKVALKAVAAVSAGVSALAGMSIKQYAEYEQLVGGVDTLFKSSSQKVQGYASEAFRTAGLSANEYLEMVTSFSASLLQSLGGDTNAAAEYANQALTDMSDNANKMGTSMEMIQNAYQGFAKQNYTMLDNLKLGYGGTKEEMARLIEDAAKLSDTVDAQDMSFANIVKAINVVQTEMGITGTTAKEAATTIQGSVGMMKAAWSNLMTSMADDNADTSKTIDEFVGSVATVYDNIAPKAKVAMNGVLTLVETVFPQIADSIPNVLNDFVPNLVKTAIGVIRNLAKSIKNNSGEIVGAAKNIIFELIDGIVAALPDIIDAINEIVSKIVAEIPSIAKKIVNALPKIIESVAKGLAQGSSKIVRAIAGWFVDIPNALQESMDSLNVLLSGVVSFSDLMDEAANRSIDLSNVLSDKGRMLSEIDDDIEQVESRITKIISDALKSQQGLREADLDNIRKYNEELQNLADEKISIYRDQQTAQLRQIQYSVESVDTPKKMAEYLGSAQAALSASNEAVNQYYASKIVQAENAHKAAGTIGTQEYHDALAAIETERSNALSQNETIYNETIAALQPYMIDLSEKAALSVSSASTYGNAMQLMISKIDEYFPMDTATFMDWTEDIITIDPGSAQYYDNFISGLNKIDYNLANSVLTMAAESIKNGDGITQELYSDLWTILDPFNYDYPGTAGESAHSYIMLIADGMEEYIPQLSYMDDLTANEIRDLIVEYLVNGTHEDGLSYVPYDGYIAELHKGERVLTAEEAKQYSKSGVYFGDINIRIDGSQHKDDRSLALAISEAIQDFVERGVAPYG